MVWKNHIEWSKLRLGEDNLLRNQHFNVFKISQLIFFHLQKRPTWEQSLPTMLKLFLFLGLPTFAPKSNFCSQ